MDKIFISYRKSDTENESNRIYNELIDHFGRKNIFRDVDNLVAGINFRGALLDALSTCGVMLVIIGQDWINATDENGNRRLENAGDFVRIEVETGLSRQNVRVIPVLVNDAPIPKVDLLPSEMKELASLQGLRIRTDSDAHFENDFSKLNDIIQRKISNSSSENLYNYMEEFSEEIVNKVTSQLIDFQDRIDAKLAQFTPVTRSIQLVHRQRRGFDGYYSWVMSNETNQDLFFAGRSVLHRIQADIQERSGARIEEIITRKLLNGASIRVLFLDPRSSLIDQLAKDEGQQADDMLTDIAISLCVCKCLYTALKQQTRFPNQTHLDIRVYDEIPYFAYHRENTKIYIGFYFSTDLGYRSAAFEALDAETQNLFQKHFEHISLRSEGNSIIQIPTWRQLPIFNESLYEELKAYLLDRLGMDKTEQLFAECI